MSTERRNVETRTEKTYIPYTVFEERVVEAVAELSSGARAAEARAKAAADRASEEKIVRKELKAAQRQAEKEQLQARADLEAAELAAADAAVVRDENGKVVPKNRPYYLQNNPSAMAAHKLRQMDTAGEVLRAQDNLANAEMRTDEIAQQQDNIEVAMAAARAEKAAAPKPLVPPTSDKAQTSTQAAPAAPQAAQAPAQAQQPAQQQQAAPEPTEEPAPEPELPTRDTVAAMDKAVTKVKDEKEKEEE